jgi:hypothetical protein
MSKTSAPASINLAKIGGGVTVSQAKISYGGCMAASSAQPILC